MEDESFNKVFEGRYGVHPDRALVIKLHNPFDAEVKLENCIQNAFLGIKCGALLSQPYIESNSNILEQFEKFYAQFPNSNDQQRKLAAIVQSTLAGKTKLLIELSFRHPLIIIRLTNGNKAYDRLLNHVSMFELNRKGESDFDTWLDNNRRIFMCVRLLFLAYLQYAKFFLDRMGIKDMNQLLDDKEKVRLFDYTLLNGATQIIAMFLDG